MKLDNIALTVLVVAWAVLFLYSANTRAAQVFEVQEAYMMKLEGDRVAVCLAYGPYTEEGGVPLYCFHSTFPTLDSISQRCRGFAIAEGPDELICGKSDPS